MQRADGFTDIFEMKHSTNVFTIDKDYANDLQNKLEAYRKLSKDKRTLHLVMVTTNGVIHNSYYNMVQYEVTMDDGLPTEWRVSIEGETFELSTDEHAGIYMTGVYSGSAEALDAPCDTLFVKD